MLINGVFEFYYSENRGAASGCFREGSFYFYHSAFVLAAAVFVLVRMPSERRFLPLTACLFLLVSGAAGNMIDRISQGYVVDFLYFKLIDFPIFNVADCYVVIATFLLMILIFLSIQRRIWPSFLSRSREKKGKLRQTASCGSMKSAELQRRDGGERRKKIETELSCA